MVRLQSKENLFYEYDPKTSLVDINAYGKCYRGVCQHGKHVLIHEIIADDDIPKHPMYHALYAPLPRFDESKIISIIDKILVYKDEEPNSRLLPYDTNRGMSRLYLIEEDFVGVSLADLIQQKASDRDTLESTVFIELKELCHANRVAFARRVTSEILKCIGYMHSLGVCARFVDPHSVIIADDGNVKYRELHSYVYMLTKSFSKDSISPDLDIRYLPLGYCAPEVFMRNRHYYIDPLSEIYSIGLLLFFILTGHDPFVGKEIEIVVQQIKGSLSLKEIDDVHLRKVIRKAIETDPKKRYQTLDEFINALNETDEYKRKTPFITSTMLLCPKCGFSCPPTSLRCPKCGEYYFHRNEEIEVTDSVGNTKRLIRLHSISDVYYEYDSNMSPVREDAWGVHHIGKCFSKVDSRFLKEVVICVIPDDSISLYANSMWNHLNKIPHSVITKTVFISIIDKIDVYPRCYIVEDFFDGVSLYDLMHGQVCGVDGQRIEFAAEMYDMYQNNKVRFAQKVAKEILGGIKKAHDLGVSTRFIEPPENILFTKIGEIKIRITNSLLAECDKQFTIIPWVYRSLLVSEYESPEGFRLLKAKVDQRSEIYTVGILTYGILTGHLPYQGKASLEDCHSVHHGPIIDPRDDAYVDKPYIGLSYDKSLLDEIKDKNLKTIIEKATKQVPDERFQSIEKFINALEGNEIIESYVCKDSPLPWYKRLYSSIYNLISGNRLLSLFLIVVIFCADLTA